MRGETGESEGGASRAGPAQPGTGLPLATWQQCPPGVGSLYWRQSGSPGGGVTSGHPEGCL